MKPENLIEEIQMSDKKSNYSVANEIRLKVQQHSTPNDNSIYTATHNNVRDTKLSKRPYQTSAVSDNENGIEPYKMIKSL